MTRKQKERQKERQEETRARKAHKEWKKTFAEITKDLWYSDIFIKVGLAVSGIQLAVAFTYTTGHWFVVFLSAFSAIGKAAFVEGGVWLINRAIMWARLTRVYWAWQVVIWLILLFLMFISVRANLDYEHEKKLAARYPQQKIVANSANVAEYLDSDERADAWFRGGLIPLIVFASIFVRRVITQAKDEYQKEEMKRFRESERQRGYREERKKLTSELSGE